MKKIVTMFVMMLAILSVSCAADSGSSGSNGGSDNEISDDDMDITTVEVVATTEMAGVGVITITDGGDITSDEVTVKTPSNSGKFDRFSISAGIKKAIEDQLKPAGTTRLAIKNVKSEVTVKVDFPTRSFFKAVKTKTAQATVTLTAVDGYKFANGNDDDDTKKDIKINLIADNDISEDYRKIENVKFTNLPTNDDITYTANGDIVIGITTGAVSGTLTATGKNGNATTAMVVDDVTKAFKAGNTKGIDFNASSISKFTGRIFDEEKVELVGELVALYGYTLNNTASEIEIAKKPIVKFSVTTTDFVTPPGGEIADSTLDYTIAEGTVVTGLVNLPEINIVDGADTAISVTLTTDSTTTGAALATAVKTELDALKQRLLNVTITSVIATADTLLVVGTDVTLAVLLTADADYTFENNTATKTVNITVAVKEEDPGDIELTPSDLTFSKEDLKNAGLTEYNVSWAMRINATPDVANSGNNVTGLTAIIAGSTALELAVTDANSSDDGGTTEASTDVEIVYSQDGAGGVMPELTSILASLIQSDKYEISGTITDAVNTEKTVLTITVPIMAKAGYVLPDGTTKFTVKITIATANGNEVQDKWADAGSRR